VGATRLALYIFESMRRRGVLGAEKCLHPVFFIGVDDEAPKPKRDSTIQGVVVQQEGQQRQGREEIEDVPDVPEAPPGPGLRRGGGQCSREGEETVRKLLMPLLDPVYGREPTATMSVVELVSPD
ncbi:unnamed protein product, partial [Amoebophrya sp. A25]